MTVSSTTSKSGPYAGNGVTTNFAVLFKYTAKADVDVIVTSSAGVETTKTLDTHYTLTVPGDTGTVSFITTPTDYRPQTGETVTIIRTMAMIQDMDLTSGGGLSANTVEANADTQLMQIQEIAERVSRAPLLRQTSAAAPITLPQPVADNLIVWNSAGTDLENKVPADLDIGLVSPFIQTLLDDLTAAAARTTLDAQQLDADLTAIAALSTTTYGRSLLTLADDDALAAQVDSFFLTSAEADALFLTPAEGNAAYQPLSAALTAYPDPTANDADALGTPTVSWSDLHLASGGVIGFANSDVTITHSANALAFAGATSGYSFDNALNISPTAASVTRALNIAQTGPTSGTHGATQYFNLIQINSDQTDVSSTAYGLGVNYGFGGANASGQRVAIVGLCVMNSATDPANPLGNAYVGVSGEGQMSSADNGTDTASGAKGTMLGLYGSSIAAAGATNLHRMAGAEFNTAIRATASARYHVGAQITQWGDHAVSGAELDAGLQFANQSGAIGWLDYGIVFDVSSAGVGTIFDAAATIIGNKGAFTVTHGINFETVSFTGAAFASPNFFVNGSGHVYSSMVAGGLNAASTLTLRATGGNGVGSEAIIFQIGNDGATEFGRITGAGSAQLLLGHTAAIAMNSESAAAFTPKYQIHSAGADATMALYRWSANANQGRIGFAKSRGASIGSRAIVQNGDNIGTIVFDGDDGTNFITAAAITARVAGTPGTNDMPGILAIQVTADGASSTTEVANFNKPVTATHTSLVIFDVDNNQLERVTVGAAGSGGVGFKLLCIPN